MVEGFLGGSLFWKLFLVEISMESGNGGNICRYAWVCLLDPQQL